MVKKTTSTVAVDQVDGMIRVIPRCSCHAGSRSRENLRRFDQSIQPGCKTQSSAFSRGFYVSAHANGGESTSGFKVTNCDLKSKRRTPLPAIRLHRIRCIDGCQHLEQPTRSSHEYDVRGRRWMDCIVRLGNGRAIGRRESTSPSCAHSCSCAGSWTRIAISLARSKPLRRNMTRNSRWSSKRSSSSLLRPSRQSAELAFTNPKSRRSLLTDHDISPLPRPTSEIRIPQSPIFFRSSFNLPPLSAIFRASCRPWKSSRAGSSIP